MACAVVEPQEVRIEKTFVDGAPSPPTLRQAVAAADGIAVVTVVAQKFFQSPGPVRGPTWTLATVSLDNVIKRHPQMNQHDGELVVWRTGGERREGNAIVREEVVGFPAFKDGEIYLLFLSWNQIWERWDLKWQERGTIRVAGASLVPIASGSIGESARGTTLNAFEK
jgi:hypothetical protein